MHHKHVQNVDCLPTVEVSFSLTLQPSVEVPFQITFYTVLRGSGLLQSVASPSLSLLSSVVGHKRGKSLCRLAGSFLMTVLETEHGTCFSPRSSLELS